MKHYANGSLIRILYSADVFEKVQGVYIRYKDAD